MDDTTIDSSDVLTVGEVAAWLKVSRRTVNRLIATGELKSMKIGGSRRVLRTDLMAYAAEAAGAS